MASSLNSEFREMLRASYGERLPLLSDLQLTDLRRAFFGGALSSLNVPYRTLHEECVDFMGRSRRLITPAERDWMCEPQ